MTSDERAVIKANAAFYEAFCRRDMKRMEALWANEHDVAVIHPGWPAVYGRDNVLASWQGILKSPSAPDVTCARVHVSVMGDAAFVVCTEQLFAGDLVATNVFVREAGNWRIAHHHASLTASDDPSLQLLN